MIANDAQSTASINNELSIANSTFDAWIELIKVVTRKTSLRKEKDLS